jgi:hypothetical protein
MTVLELDFERRAGKRFDDAADEAQRIFFDDGGQRLAALFAATALASARRRNGNSLRGYLVRCCRVFAAGDGFARERGFRAREAPVQRNSAVVKRVEGPAMLTSAIVFGMVGVAAGFTWDYVINRGK